MVPAAAHSLAEGRTLSENGQGSVSAVLVSFTSTWPTLESSQGEELPGETASTESGRSQAFGGIFLM